MARFWIFHLFSEGMFLKHVFMRVFSQNELNRILTSNGHILHIYNT